MDDRQNNGRQHIELHGAAVVGFCADGYEACKYMVFINVCMLLTYFSCVEFYNFCLTCFKRRAISFATSCFCYDAACTTCQSIILVISIEATVKICKFPLVQRNKRLAVDVATSGALRKIAI
jgi:hypothetical protein